MFPNSGCLYLAAADELTGHRSGRFAVVKYHFAAYDRIFVPFRALDEPLAVGREVENDFRRARTQTIEIDQVDVGFQTGKQRAAVFQTIEQGGFTDVALAAA